MTLTGTYRGRPLFVLIDYGSTHNFLSTKVAKRVKCPLQPVSNIKVIVANGQDLCLTMVCPDFTRKMQGHEFSTNVYLFPLDNYDLILG